MKFRFKPSALFKSPQKRQFPDGKELQVRVEGMTCSSCARRLNLLFSAQPAVSSVTVDLDAGLLLLRLKRGKTLPETTIQKLIEEAGYTFVGIAEKDSLPASRKFKKGLKVEVFTAECCLCERTLYLLREHFPGLPLEVHRASECVDGSCCLLAEHYGIKAVPAIVVNGQLVVTGVPEARDLDRLENLITSARVN